MTSFNLRQVKLRPGEQLHDQLEVELAPLQYGGQRYLPVPEKVPAAFELTRATTGTVFGSTFTARLHGPCYRCLGDAVLEVPIDAREYQATSPDRRGADDAVHRGREPRRLGVGARLDRTRAPGEDPLPARLRRPLRRVRQEPERRAARARGGAQRPPLGRARGAARAKPRPAVTGMPKRRRAAFHQDDVAPRAALLRDPLAGADDPEAAALVQGDRGVVAGQDPGLDRPDPDPVGPPDELLEQRSAEAAAARRPADIDRVLDDAAVTRARRDGRERGPAEHCVLACDEARLARCAASHSSQVGTSSSNVPTSSPSS